MSERKGSKRNIYATQPLPRPILLFHSLAIIRVALKMPTESLSLATNIDNKKKRMYKYHAMKKNQKLPPRSKGEAMTTEETLMLETSKVKTVAMQYRVKSEIRPLEGCRTYTRMNHS
jgi:hypothetical protein